MKNELSEWLLVDGALADKCPAGQQLRSLKMAVPLYQDFGPEAAIVGPWLIESTAEANQFLQQWQESREDAAFGIAWLKTSVAKTTLQKHLVQMRYVRSAHQPDKRYFLRYADTRCMGALWPSLRPEQQATLLGSISCWSWQQLDGNTTQLRSPETKERLRFPLPLRGKQFQAMTEEARLGGFISEANQFFPELSEEYSLKQQYEGAKKFMCWNAHHHIESPEYQMTVLVAIVKSGESVLDSLQFKQVVQQAQAESNSKARRDKLGSFV